MLYLFWKDEPIDEYQLGLLEALFEGHREATFRQNISSEVVKAAFIGSGDFNKAVAAAVSTLGGKHAPIVQAYEILSTNPKYLPLFLKSGIVEGWGNSFVKGRPDPIWEPTHNYMKHWPEITWKIDTITNELHNRGKKVYPNAACYTAATAHIIGMPKNISPMLVHCARLPAWAELCYESMR